MEQGKTSGKFQQNAEQRCTDPAQLEAWIAARREFALTLPYLPAMAKDENNDSSEARYARICMRTLEEKCVLYSFDRSLKLPMFFCLADTNQGNWIPEGDQRWTTPRFFRIQNFAIDAVKRTVRVEFKETGNVCFDFLQLPAEFGVPKHQQHLRNQ